MRSIKRSTVQSDEMGEQISPHRRRTLNMNKSANVSWKIEKKKKIAALERLGLTRTSPHPPTVRD